jgi:hypothetical protein
LWRASADRSGVTSALTVWNFVSSRIFSTISSVVFCLEVGIEIEAVDYFQQLQGAHDALVDGVETLLRVARDRGGHVFARDLLVLDENGRRGAVLGSTTKAITAAVTNSSETAGMTCSTSSV